MGGPETVSRLRSLIEVNQLLMGALEPDELIRAILESVVRLFRAGGCSVALIDERAGELAFAVTAGSGRVGEFRVPLGQGVAGAVAESGEPVLTNDPKSDERFFAGIDERTGFETHSILCVPLKRRDSVIGVLEVLNHPEGFSDGDLELLSGVAGLATTALERSRVFARLTAAKTALQLDSDDRYCLVRGESVEMREVLDIARTAAGSPATILLLGESGVGKEVFARAIHSWSARTDGPFVAINCVALSPALLESELFGHEKGAFTGATSQKKGMFELADSGTIFLDEIGELAPSLQVKFLRVLQEHEFQRVGGVKDLRADVRVIAATNRDLQQAIQTGQFRQDLYYRLNVVSLTIPPLRERRVDIRALSEHFLSRYARELGRLGLQLSDAAVACLSAYSWPGNVRELQNAIERASVLSLSDVIGEADLPAEVRGPVDMPGLEAPAIDADLPLSEALEVFKIARIRAALDATSGNRTRAAKLLGIQQPNLSRMMKTLAIK